MMPYESKAMEKMDASGVVAGKIKASTLRPAPARGER
jgi:hypothetical protein